MKLYLAGPMRGYTKHNFPAFDAAAAHLRSFGHEVFNPADHDREIGFSEDTVEVPPETLSAMMRWDLARVMEVDAVAFLPGWEKSRGACAERTVAHYLGLPCYDVVYRAGPIVPTIELVPQPEFAEPVITWTPKEA